MRLLAPWRFFTLAAALFAPLAARAQEAAYDGDPGIATAAAPQGLTIMAETEPAKVAPGGKFEVVVHVVAPTGGHAYPNAKQNPENGSALTFSQAGGAQMGEVVWPKGAAFTAKNGIDWGVVYHGETLIRIPGKAPSTPGICTIRGAFHGAWCQDEGNCFPPTDYPFEVKLTVDAAAIAPPSNPTPPEIAPQASGMDPISFDLPWGKATVDPNTFSGLALFLLLAAVGGFILNFMPCVLPVIPIKILGLAHAAGTRSRRLWLGGLMSGGVIALWLGIGSVLAFSTALGGTAEIFRYPVVNLLLGLFIVLMAVSATGLFAIRLPQFVYAVNPKHDSAAGSFGFGVMTGVFALPCTGPFMGTAAAAVLAAHDTRLTLAVFAAIGVGMAVPYFVLAANPKWVEKLPRSGPASDVMKHFLGWMMLAGGIYFIQSGLTQWIQPESHFGKRAGVMLAVAVFGAAGVALAWGCVGLLKTSARKLAPSLFLAFGVGLAAFGGWQTYQEIVTLPFPFARFADEAQLPLGKGKITVVDFRSTNCLNCDYNEKTAFNTAAGKALLGAADVVAYQANIDHSADAAFLQKISGNVAVPFLAVYDGQGRLVEKMSAIITTEQLRLAIEKARQAGK